MTLSELNQLSREAFVAAMGWVFEYSPWIAEQAWAARAARQPQPQAGVLGTHRDPRGGRPGSRLYRDALRGGGAEGVSVLSLLVPQPSFGTHYALGIGKKPHAQGQYQKARGYNQNGLYDPGLFSDEHTFDLISGWGQRYEPKVGEIP